MSTGKRGSQDTGRDPDTRGNTVRRHTGSLKFPLLGELTAQQPSQPGAEAPNVWLCAEPQQPGSCALAFILFFNIFNCYLFGDYLKLLCPSFTSCLAAATFIKALNSEPKGVGPKKHRFESFPRFPRAEDFGFVS